MKKGFTLFEGLTLLLVLALITLLSQPYWHNISRQLAISTDEKRLLLFLRVIQSQANTQNTDYQLRVSRDLSQGRWCLTAQSSNAKDFCDCLQIERCQSQQVSVYFPNPVSGTMIFNYSEKFPVFKGDRNTIEGACFLLQAKNYQRILSIAGNGRIRWQEHLSNSQCKKYLGDEYE